MMLTILLLIAVLILAPVALGQRFRILDLVERVEGQRLLIADLCKKIERRGKS
jgi:hypothetical protein